MDKYNIVNTTGNDLEFIYSLFDEAIAYQKRKNYNVWKGYDKEVLKKDIENKLQYKVIEGNNILCIFSVCYSDRIIWREKERGDAIYLHRMVVNTQNKGHKQFERILNWAVSHAEERNLKYIRMDTWGDNPKLIDYYQSFGFKFLEKYATPDSEELPSQHRNLGLALLEYEI